jgi:hypothetical protein
VRGASVDEGHTVIFCPYRDAPYKREWGEEK